MSSASHRPTGQPQVGRGGVEGVQVCKQFVGKEPAALSQELYPEEQENKREERERGGLRNRESGRKTGVTSSGLRGATHPPLACSR